MELQENQMAANTEEIANPQDDVNLEQSEQQTDNNQESQTVDNDSQQDVTQTQAFAHRLREEKAKARDELIAEMYGETHGIHTYEQYQQALAEAQEAERLKYYQEQGVDPDLINQAIEEHPDVQYAREMRAKQQAENRLRYESDQLFQEFPDLQIKDIPQQAWDMYNRGVPLDAAYKASTYGQVKSQAEQETIRKLQANATSSPGSLGEGTEHTTSVSNMSLKDIEAMAQAVLRGEKKSL